ncbi:MAG: hypothetical protein WDN31_07280 [Hyphomicrobium sp.]
MAEKGGAAARAIALAALMAAALTAGLTSARGGQNEDWCLSDQEKTDEEALAGCTALIDAGKLSKDKLAKAYTTRCLVYLRAQR